MTENAQRNFRAIDMPGGDGGEAPSPTVSTITQSPDGTDPMKVHLALDPAASASWNFGDGSPEPDAGPDGIEHTYGTEGSYSVSATIGGSIVATAEVVVPALKKASVRRKTA